MKYIALATMLAACSQAAAQSTHMDMPEGSKEVQVMLAAVHGPSSVGSAQSATFIAPYFSVQWSNGVFLKVNQLGVHLSDQPNLEYGLTAIPTFSRPTALPDERERPKRKFTPEMGGFLNYRVAHGISVTSSLLYGGGIDHRGLRMHLGAHFWMPVAEHHSLGVTTGLVLANRAALRANFAVSPEQTRGALAPHEVSGGVHSTALGGHWSWAITHKYKLGTWVEFSRLHGSAAASPRVRQAHGVTAGTTLSYGF